jgi:hypothetical protein
VDRTLESIIGGCLFLRRKDSEPTIKISSAWFSDCPAASLLAVLLVPNDSYPYYVNEIRGKNF